MVKQTQLQLVPNLRPAWELTEETKRVGRAGLAEARRVLSTVQPQQDVLPQHDSPIAA